MQAFRRLGVSWWKLGLCACVGSVFGLGLYTFSYAQGGSYFSSDPNACANCHIMREPLDSWQHASHHAHAKCVDCHLPHDLVGKYVAKAENGFWHSKGFTLQDFPDPIRIKPKNARILQENCIKCHGGLVGDLQAHGAFADGSNQCVRCHVSVGHGAPR
ncbi:MAG: cytochrome c nitrite reductase small subunit [Planctomycetes bacterium]|nr:cytochrome c nitrite reductase small subunit [Planctomycetota bacterium]